MKFVKRLTAPAESNKFYSTFSPFYKYKNGKNSMFKRHPFLKGNCTHYAHSRFMEINNITACSLSTNDAIKWYDKTKKYEKSKTTPKLGAVIVYKHKKKDGGHVAIVEEIKANGNLLLSMSGYNTYLFKTRTVKKSNNYCYSDYELLGFIYSPNNFDEEARTEEKSGYSKEFPKLPSRGYFKKNDKGTEVKKLQAFLNWSLDLKLVCDGILGAKSQEAIKQFQKKVGIKADGLFGKSSLAKAKEFKK